MPASIAVFAAANFSASVGANVTVIAAVPVAAVPPSTVLFVKATLYFPSAKLTVAVVPYLINLLTSACTHAVFAVWSV